MVSRNIPFDLLSRGGGSGGGEKEEVWKRWWGEGNEEVGTGSENK